MFVNANDESVKVTLSSTPTTYKIVPGAMRICVRNVDTSECIVKLETSSVSTLTAPVVGTPFRGTPVIPNAPEILETNPDTTHISVYSASGTGTLYIQSTMGQ